MPLARPSRFQRAPFVQLRQSSNLAESAGTDPEAIVHGSKRLAGVASHPAGSLSMTWRRAEVSIPNRLRGRSAFEAVPGPAWFTLQVGAPDRFRSGYLGLDRAALSQLSYGGKRGGERTVSIPNRLRGHTAFKAGPVPDWFTLQKWWREVESNDR